MSFNNFNLSDFMASVPMDGLNDPTKPKAQPQPVQPVAQPAQPAPPVDPVQDYLNARHAYLSTTAPSDDPTKPEPPRSTFVDGLNTFDNALTFGLGQKFNAAVDAAGAAIRGRDSFGHAFNQSLASQQQGIQGFTKAHPYAAAALNAVGTVPTILATGPERVAAVTADRAAPVAQGLLSQLLSAGKTGVKAGATYGALNAAGNASPSEGIGGTLRDVAKGTAIGAGAGGVLAAGAVPASAVLAKAYDMLAPKAMQMAARFGSDAMLSPLTAVNDAPLSQEVAGSSAPRQSAPTPPQVTRADALLLRRLQNAGLTPQEAIDRAEKIPTDKPASVMEVAGDMSHPMVELGKWVARSPSTGAAQLRAAVEARSNPLPNAQRVLGDVSDLLGVDRTNLVDNGATLKGQQLANAKPFYDASVNNPDLPPVPLTLKAAEDGPSLGDLLKRPSIKGAMKFHNDIAAERDEEPLTLPADQADVPKGYPPFNPSYARDEEQWRQTVDMARAQGIEIPGGGGAPEAAPEAAAEAAGVPLKTLQQLKFKLDDALGFAKRNGHLPWDTEATAATKAKLGAINDTRAALLDIMAAHSPEYAQGNAAWAGDAAVQNAGQEGRDFLSRPIDELQNAYPGMSAAEQAQHNIAAVSDPLRDRLFKANAVDRAKILRGADMQERLGVVANPANQEAFDRNLGIEHRIAVTNQQIPGGSDTYANAVNDADASVGPAKSAITGLVMGRPRRVLSSVVRAAVTPAIDNWVRGVNEQTANALAPKLTAGMMSRDDLIQMLYDLADKHNYLSRRPPLPSMLGRAAGATAGILPERNP